MRSSLFNKLVPSCKVDADDRRLVLASVPVLLFFISTLAMQGRSFYEPFPKHKQELNRKQAESERSRVYPVLIKQTQKLQKKSRHIPTLSDVDSSASGGLSRRQGFHSLSPRDNLSLAEQKPKNKQQNNRKEASSQTQDNFPIIRKQSSKSQQSPLKGREKRFHIPSNYRFRQDFLLRFDGTSLLTLPRKKLVGFAYFRQMIQKIRENFSPPGMNYMYRDQAGYIINQTIKPQVVQVLFALDPMGNVSDVRKVHSLDQKLVDEACLNSLRGNNFGKPPPEIFKKGNIFGINFVFPNLRR